MTAGMILSSADILRILGRNEVIRLSAQVSIVDGKPALSGREGIHIYVNRFPVLEEFEATWQIWIESDEEDDLIIAELQRLLPRVQVVRGLMTTVSTTEFRSENTQRAPEAPRLAQAQADLTAFEDRFQALVEDVQDRMLLVASGRAGRDGRDGTDGAPGRDGRDIDATEANLEDLQNVEQNIAKEDGQVLTWKDGVWQNLFIPQIISSISGGGTQSPSSNPSLIGSGEWRYNAGTAGNPASGRLQFNTADPSLATEIYVSRYNNEGKDVYNLLPAIVTAGTLFYVQGGSADNYYLYDVIADAVQVSGTHLLVSVTLNNEGTDSGFSNNQVLGVSAYGTGSGGPTINKLDDIGDVDVPAPGDGYVLAFNTATGNWEAAAAPPADISGNSIDDLADVDTSTAVPLTDQALAWNGTNWVPADHVQSVGGKTGAVTLEKADITDFSDADYATAAQGALADTAVQPGDNISVLTNDAGYITLAEVPASGIPEAPQDGNYYVRQNGSWVDLADALANLNQRNIDGGNFTTNTTTADSNYIVDGGSFS